MKTKKIIIALILICAFTPVFGCKKPNKSESYIENGSRLVFVEKTEFYSTTVDKVEIFLYYDEYTLVMYQLVKCRDNVEVEVMLDGSGKPVKYDENWQKEHAKKNDSRNAMREGVKIP